MECGEEEEDYIKKELRLYKDFVNSHIDEIIQNPEAKNLYDLFRDSIRSI
jgi:hypothetical protein